MQSKLKRYVERAKEIIDQAPQMGEANTKEMLIRRFNGVLGWDFLPSEVNLEYPVRMAGLPSDEGRLRAHAGGHADRIC